MKFLTTILVHEPLLQKARSLKSSGTVYHHNKYVYLKIDDAFIHELHPLIGNIGTFIMPDHQIGAHISIMYPEESIHVSSYDLNKTHDFVINAIADAILEDKRYIVLIVSSSSLSNLRTRYFLDERPCYKGVSVEFHITIATCYIGSPEVVRDR